MNQDQYHASLLNKGQPIGLGWDGVTKATQPKVYPPEPPNQTDPEESIKRVRDDDSKLLDLNWNNIKVSTLFIYLFDYINIYSGTLITQTSISKIFDNSKQCKFNTRFNMRIQFFFCS